MESDTLDNVYSGHSIPASSAEIVIIKRDSECHGGRAYLAEVVRTAEHNASFDLIPTHHTAVVLDVLTALLYLFQITMSSLARLQVLFVLVSVCKAFLDGALESSLKVYGTDSVTKLL
jgi:hypothetical protein